MPKLPVVIAHKLNSLQRNTLRAVRKAAAALDRDSGHTVMGGPFWEHAERASKEAEDRAAQAGLTLLSDNPTVQSAGGAADITSSSSRVEAALGFVAGLSPELRQQLQEQREKQKADHAAALVASQAAAV